MTIRSRGSDRPVVVVGVAPDGLDVVVEAVAQMSLGSVSSYCLNRAECTVSLVGLAVVGSAVGPVVVGSAVAAGGSEVAKPDTD